MGRKEDIRNEIRTDRIGEKRLMNCGLEAEIIAYRSSRDIDIRFSDQTIVEHTHYRGFKTGNVRHPNYSTQIMLYRKMRVGEKRMMQCGLEAEITQWFNARNITVRFSGGCEVTHKSYNNFSRGKIGHPKIKTRRRRKCAVGES